MMKNTADTERYLKRAFDFQCFEQNAALSELISETESRCLSALTDDELELVNAAGDFESLLRSGKEKSDAGFTNQPGRGLP